jgi:hypothetical protein
MIVYVLFVHKKSVLKRKVCIIFIKNLKFKKTQKKHFYWVFLGGFFVFFGWVFYCQPCMKEDVLSDLPPKITQDYVCDLSPLQIQLYEDFARSRVSKKMFWAFPIIGTSIC